jgi:hypothetical protein
MYFQKRDHILISNILFFNKLRQIIPEVRREMRDLLIFIVYTVASQIADSQFAESQIAESN